jgi:dual specificity MAP kinase phosphatase
LYWITKHSFREFKSRVYGQLLGLPFRGDCEITKSLWIGAKPGLLGRWILRANGFTIQFSLIEKKEIRVRPRKLTYLWRPLEEFRAIPTKALWEYTDELLILQSQEQRVFIHCREGVGRAPALGVALLIRLGASLDTALAQVQSGRNVTSLNDAQLSSLLKFYNQFKFSRS